MKAGPALLLLVSGLFAGCKNEGGPAPERFDSGVLHISADESFKPVVDAQIQVYQAQYPDARIVAHYKPEAECIRDFLVDSIRVVITTRSVSEREKAAISDSLKLGPESVRVAYDAIAVVVNPQSPDSFFTLQALRDLVGGKAKKKPNSRF